MSEVTALKLALLRRTQADKCGKSRADFERRDKEPKGSYKKASLTHTTELFEVDCYGGKNGKSKN